MTASPMFGRQFDSRWLRNAAALLGTYVLLGGAVSLTGWTADVPRLTDWFNDGISIQPNTALAAMAAGVALLLRVTGYVRTSALLGALLVAIGGSVIAEYVLHADFGIDTVLMFGRTWGRGSVAFPGRMGPPAATSWMAIGLAFLLMPGRSEKVRAWIPGFALLAATIASLSLIGYFYGASSLYTITTTTAIALQTSTFIFAVSVGIVLSVSDIGLGRLIADPGPAGVLTRRILPAIIGVPIVLGFVRLAGDQAGMYDLAFGTAVRTLLEIAFLLGLLWWTANAIRHQALQREEAQQLADRRKDEFLATLAHELRNPLAPIRTAAELIKARAYPDSELQWARGVINRQVDVMVRLLDDLLDIGRISSNKLDMRTQRVDLVAVLRGAMETCDPTVRAGQHDLSITLPASPIYLNADPARLGQVFGNLLTNACRYSEPLGRISVMVARDAAQAVVTIRDAGIGIPPDQLTGVFEIFAQVPDPLGRSKGGLGVGLYIVKRIVEMHGGTVEARSDGVGRGSEFVVRLPMLTDHIEVEPGPDVELAGSGARRILVVDDNVDAAESLALLLDQSGNDVHTAHDGLEGLDAAERIRPDVVLLDLGLPRLNGFDVCRRIRERPWAKDTVLIALTGWGQEADRRRSREAGFDHHVVKPVEHGVLLALLSAGTSEPVV